MCQIRRPPKSIIYFCRKLYGSQLEINVYEPGSITINVWRYQGVIRIHTTRVWLPRLSTINDTKYNFDLSCHIFCNKIIKVILTFILHVWCTFSYTNSLIFIIVILGSLGVIKKNLLGYTVKPTLNGTSI